MHSSSAIPSRFALSLLAALPAAAVQAQTATFLPATGVGLVPPKGMTPSRTFSGFEDPATGASILVAEFPLEAYGQIAPTFTPEGLNAGGLTIEGAAVDWPVSGGQGGKLVRGHQSASGADFRKWVLLARSPNRTVMISVQVPQSKAAAYPDAAIDGALKTVQLRATPDVSAQIGALPFRIGDMAGFRPVRVLAGSALLLTDGPRDVISDASQPVVVVASSLDAVGKGDSAARNAFARQALNSVPGVSDILVEEEKLYDQDGATWSRVAAKGTYREAGEAVWVLQLIRFTPTGYIRTLGITRTLDKPRLQPRIERIAATAAPK